MSRSSNVTQLVWFSYIECAECRSEDFKLKIDKVGDDWTKIIGVECSHCGCAYNCEIPKEAL